jgi:hypothetical protein
LPISENFNLELNHLKMQPSKANWVSRITVGILTKKQEMNQIPDSGNKQDSNSNLMTETKAYPSQANSE